jgi:GNAT superfamily N-acetyltransferase
VSEVGRSQKREVRVQKSDVEPEEGRKTSVVSRSLFVRPMTMADRPAVLRISSRIWDGHDYVPTFFERWVSEGGFWAGVVRNRLVGYGKATQLSPGEWWLEGLRVDPSFRNRGVGKELSRQVLYRTLDERPVSLRLATADVNQESIHIIEKVMGFKPYVQYRFLLGQPGKSEPVRPLVRPSIAEVQRYIERSPELEASRGLLQYTWLFRNLDRRHASALVRDGYVLGYRAAGRLAGLMVMRPHRYHGNDLDISFVAGTDKVLAAFRSFLSRVAQECGSRNISGMAASDEMAGALRSLGMEPHPHIRAVLVYEYPI